MKKFATILISWVICFFIVLPGTGNAGNDFNSKKVKDKKIEISHPSSNGVVEGYFLPVSWRDSFVENSKTPYPDNYSASDRKYHVTVSDKTGVTLLEEIVSGQNYWVFSYDEIKDVLDQKIYYLKVEELSSQVSSDKLHFFYQKPYGEIPDFSEIPQEISEPVISDESAESLAISDDTAEFEALAMSTSAESSCPYCRAYNWFGVLVAVLSTSQHDKHLTVHCQQVKWYEGTFAASYNGPVFINLPAGDNFKVSYNDQVYDIFRCVKMYAWGYTIIRLP